MLRSLMFGAWRSKAVEVDRCTVYCKDFSLVICHDSSSALLFVCLFLLQTFKNKNFMRLLAEDAEVFCHVGG